MSVHETSLPTVSVSRGVAWVVVPSVPWIVNWKAPLVALPTVTLKAIPAGVGTSEDGEIWQMLGAPVVQLNVTVLL